MGRIVAVFATSHAPGMTGIPHLADEKQRENVYRAFGQLKERLEAARPDALVCISNDHLTNFFLNNMPTFCIGVADRYFGPPPEFERLTGVGPRTFPGHEALGRAILREALDSGFDPSFSGELVIDDNFAGPFHLLMPEKVIPLVLIIVNAVEPPMPTLMRCYQLGAVLRRVIERQTVAERVAILATGGISHWVGTPEMGQINTDFDHKILDLVAQGRGEDIARLSDEEVAAAGNGAYEIRNWLVALGAVPGVKFDVLAYEPVHPWITGIGVTAAQISG
jgi:protocatechuate 4,5-dioxygenase beta chain/2,3-dihydroxyphenylpropionate 1,2-dioxygenase